MTLLELLVVVAILAILASVAIQSTSEIGEQTRYDATQKTVEAFRGAVLGPSGQLAPDGSSILSGFLSDMGRLPLAKSITTADGDQQGSLLELYSESLPGDLKAYSVHTVTSGNTFATLGSGDWSRHTNEVFGGLASGFIRVPAGWRGPYLRKPSSVYTLVDGWEKPIVSRWELGLTVDVVQNWPTMLLEFRTITTGTLGYGPSQAYTPILTSGREVSGVFCGSGFDGSFTPGTYSATFDSLISQSEIRNDLIVQVTVPAGKYSTASSFPLLLMSYGPNPNVAIDNKPVQVYAQQSPLAASQIQFTLAGSLAPSVGVRVFRAVLKTNSVANTSATNYVRSPPIVVPVTRFTQSINIPLP